MGRKRTQKKDFKEQRQNKWDSQPHQAPELDNADFEMYYKQQHIVPEGEWEAFMACLRTTLPITFRINGSGKFADALRRRLETDFLAGLVREGQQVSGEVLKPPTAIPWYPAKLAWQLDANRTQLRKIAALGRLHDFMKRENDAGGITRQEAVSMVPPLLLDVQPHHLVLDMCAAPGSKTFQLLEALHAGPAPATGLVIANDSDVQRCNLLTHQVKRMCSPSLLVTNHEAQSFPSIKHEDGSAIAFDRILCDVPCSGDGTMRKAPDIWRRWTVANGNGLHGLQINITLRACQLLKEGGQLIYSTCTFNPMEDEAVVAEILRRTRGSIELVDASELLPGLKRTPGLRRWRPFDKQKQAFFDTHDEARAAGALKMDRTMFPDALSDEMPLERCMRVLPHHGDTGGFFIALLRKVAPVGDLAFSLTNSRKRQLANKAAEAAPGAGIEDAVNVLSPAPDAAAGAGGAAQLVAEPTTQPPVLATEQLPSEQQPAAGCSDHAEMVMGPMPTELDATAEMETDAAAVTDGVDKVPVTTDAEDAAAAPMAVLMDETAADDQGEGATIDVDKQQVADAAAPAQDREADAAVRGGTDAWPAGAASDAAAAPSATDVPTPADGAASSAAQTGTDKVWGPVVKAQGSGPGRGKWAGVDPVNFITDEGVLSSLVQYYGFGGPSEDVVRKHLVTRSEDATRPKRVYLVAPSVRELLLADRKGQLKVMSTGVKTFERQDSKDGSIPCNYRIVQEGLAALLPLMSAQTFRLTVDEFERIVTERSVPVPSPAPVAAPSAPGTTDAAPSGEAATVAGGGAAPSQEPPAAAEASGADAEAAAAPADATNGSQQALTGGDQQLKKEGRPRVPLADPITLEQLEAVRPGCCVAILRNEDAVALDLPRESDTDSALTAAAPLAIACFRGRSTVSVLVSKQECLILQDRVKAAKEHAAAAAASSAAQHVTATDIPAMDTAAADGSAVVVDTAPVADAAEGPVVVTTDVLSCSDATGALHNHKPVEEVAAAVALVGDKRTAEVDAAEVECVPSKRMAE